MDVQHAKVILSTDMYMCICADTCCVVKVTPGARTISTCMPSVPTSSACCYARQLRMQTDDSLDDRVSLLLFSCTLPTCCKN